MEGEKEEQRFLTIFPTFCTRFENSHAFCCRSAYRLENSATRSCSWRVRERTENPIGFQIVF